MAATAGTIPPNKLDIGCLPDMPEISIGRYLYQCSKKPKELTLPAIEDQYEIKFLERVTEKEAIEMLKNLSKRKVYSINGLHTAVNQDIPCLTIRLKHCEYCHEFITGKEMLVDYYCWDCHHTMCCWCFAQGDEKKMADLIATDGQRNSIVGHEHDLKALTYCKNNHRLERRTYPIEVLPIEGPIKFSDNSFYCDVCKISIGDDRHFFHLPSKMHVCTNCVAAAVKEEDRKILREYLPGQLTARQFATMTGFPLATGDRLSHVGSFLDWVPVFREKLVDKSTAEAAQDSKQQPSGGGGGDDDDEPIDQDGLLEPGNNQSLILVNCNPESKMYGKVVIMIQEDGLEYWFTQEEFSLKEVIGLLFYSSGGSSLDLRDFVIRKRYRAIDNNNDDDDDDDRACPCYNCAYDQSSGSDSDF
jgi:hypothetical protein